MSSDQPYSFKDAEDQVKHKEMFAGSFLPCEIKTWLIDDNQKFVYKTAFISACALVRLSSRFVPENILVNKPSTEYTSRPETVVL